MDENRNKELENIDSDSDKKRSLEEELAKSLIESDERKDEIKEESKVNIRDAHDIYRDEKKIKNNNDKDHKNVFETVGSGFLHIVRGYWSAFKEWVKSITISKSERWAMATCLLLALTVWIYVINVDDTGHQESVEYVSVELDGMTALKNLNMSVIGGYDNAITVTLRGKRSDIGSLTPEDIYAYVDLSGVTEVGRHSLPVKVDAPQNSTLVSIVKSSSDTPFSFSVYSSVISGIPPFLPPIIVLPLSIE